MANLCLPNPFDDVQFTWDASDRYIEIVYVGSAERLIECGAIEPHMARKATKGDPKPRADSAGHWFGRDELIVREPLAKILRVTRQISDSKFAESLPGVPRGLRFKRLEWLAAHPGQIHVSTVENLGQYAYSHKFLAGTAAAFVAHGYSEKIFRGKMVQRIGMSTLLNAKDHGIGCDYAHLYRLMRGYFEIDFCKAKPFKEERTAVSASMSRPAHRLRLVVDNSPARH